MINKIKDSSKNELSFFICQEYKKQDIENKFS